ncbi:hypothetical protein [Plastoroseomonas arctica]|nr:hypothetical protein [Plastoroseomonas arctica]
MDEILLQSVLASLAICFSGWSLVATVLPLLIGNHSGPVPSMEVV